MDIKERTRALTNGFDPYFQALFVFTSARVEAKWGTTSSVHSITDEQLWPYIVDNTRSARLSSHQVKTIAQAFLGLAHMETDFTIEAAKPKPQAAMQPLNSRPPAIANRPYHPPLKATSCS